MAIATITPEGYIEIPKEFLDQLHVHAGDEIELEMEPGRAIRIRPKPLAVSEVAGMLKPYIRKALTLEEIDEGVAEAFRKGEL